MKIQCSESVHTRALLDFFLRQNSFNVALCFLFRFYCSHGIAQITSACLNLSKVTYRMFIFNACTDRIPEIEIRPVQPLSRCYITTGNAGFDNCEYLLTQGGEPFDESRISDDFRAVFYASPFLPEINRNEPNQCMRDWSIFCLFIGPI